MSEVVMTADKISWHRVKPGKAERGESHRAKLDGKIVAYVWWEDLGPGRRDWEAKNPEGETIAKCPTLGEVRHVVNRYYTGKDGT